MTKFKEGTYALGAIEYITNIQSIDDLVRFSNMVNIGYNYSNKTVYLDKSLDFEDDASYINPERTDLGDVWDRIRRWFLPSVPYLFHAPGYRRRLHSRCPSELHDV